MTTTKNTFKLIDGFTNKYNFYGNNQDIDKAFKENISMFHKGDKIIPLYNQEQTDNTVHEVGENNGKLTLFSQGMYNTPSGYLGGGRKTVSKKRKTNRRKRMSNRRKRMSNRRYF